jgi:DNA-directed RNA polymerase specialized sigma24 family protein
VDCGEKDPRVLQFDHVKGEKKAAITELAYCTKVSIEALTVEMSKCVVRCANCHLKRTWDDRGYREPSGAARKRSRKQLPADRAAALCRRRTQGLSYEQLGWEFGVSPGTAWRIVKQSSGDDNGKQGAVQEDGGQLD